MNDLLISFYGDDFTGSTDAMESLARGGLRTVLFTSPPTAEQLGRYPGLQAYGVAGMTRSMRPEEMERHLRPVLAALRDSGAPIVQYKVCSTFDSSPTVGSIGRVIDIAAEMFESEFVPIVIGAPSLGRYCIFGNLFAESGQGSPPYRLDRHPSMSRHPITPMDEADLRLHLAKQTSRPIELFDIRQLAQPPEQVDRAFDRLISDGARTVLIDLLYESQLATVGRLLHRHARLDRPLFVVGSSGVSSALVAWWKLNGRIEAPDGPHPPGDPGPILVVCGSCSPVTAGQIAWAVRHRFSEIRVDLSSISNPTTLESIAANTAKDAANALRSGRNAVIHTGAASAERRVSEQDSRHIGRLLGQVTRRTLDAHQLRRVIIAGGDTSGQIARTLEIESMEMVAELVRGAPLCRVRAPNSPAHGIEMAFKGGQVGGKDFFGRYAGMVVQR
jgi:3-oxoisoapionate kinase